MRSHVLSKCLVKAVVLPHTAGATAALPDNDELGRGPSRHGNAGICRLSAPKHSAEIPATFLVGAGGGEMTG